MTKFSLLLTQSAKINSAKLFYPDKSAKKVPAKLNFSRNPQNQRKLVPAKLSSLKVLATSQITYYIFCSYLKALGKGHLMVPKIF